jgi:hypothetical protein
MNLKRKMMMLVGVVAFAGAAAYADPVVNIDPARHPNMAAAQGLVRDAWYKVDAAQKANQYALGGHAARAKQLLEEANRELKEAAITANSK